MSAVAVTGLHKSFGKAEVLRGIDLEVAEHEVVCLIGASGSGKSTLLRCINLLERVDAGRIFVAGEEITRRGVDVNRVRRRIGIVFQAFNLFPHMSVLANVTLGPTKALGLARREAGPLLPQPRLRRRPRPGRHEPVPVVDRRAELAGRAGRLEIVQGGEHPAQFVRVE